VPLAICDRRTIADEDIEKRTGVHQPSEADGPIAYKIGGVHFNAEQRWHYFPDLRSNELIIFTGLDTSRLDNSWKVAHAGFDNRCATPDAVPRISVETRHYAFFE
jgi:hypothetical protein